jgi:hypothetical protein
MEQVLCLQPKMEKGRVGWTKSPPSRVIAEIGKGKTYHGGAEGVKKPRIKIVTTFGNKKHCV